MEKFKFKIVLFLLVTVIGGLYAQTSFSEDDFWYTVENGKATIIRYIGSDENLIIPEKLGGYEVITIGNNAFWDCSSLTTIEIPDSVTSIGDGAFAYCENLSTVEIPDSVISIGKGAFEWCTSLTTIKIPDSVNSIGNFAFNATGLITLEIPDSVTSIGKGAFHTYSLITAKIPDSVISIGEMAFTKSKGDILTIIIETEDSSAHKYALERGINFVLE